MHESKPLLAYLITWTCYGQWLHGDRRGSVDNEHNQFGELWHEANRQLEHEIRQQLQQPPYEMDEPRRKVVLEAIQSVCRYRGWQLHAVHVRDNHVHVVVTASADPDKVMKDFKAYASRALNERGFDTKERTRWTRHGSTKYIYEPSYFNAAINYVLNKQGTTMQRWPDNDLKSHERQ